MTLEIPLWLAITLLGLSAWLVVCAIKAPWGGDQNDQ